MRLKLKYKLFIIILSISLVIVAGIFLISKITFRHQFLNYLEQREIKRVTVIAKVIEENHSHEKDLQFLVDQPEIFLRLERSLFRPKPGRFGPPPDRDFRDSRRRKPGPGFEDKRGHHKGSPFKGLRIPIVLLDRDKNPLIGMVHKEFTMKTVPIRLNNKIAGWIGVYPERNIRFQGEKRFVENQYRMFLIISMGMILISVIVAVWASYYLEKPIKVVADGAKKLASGNFDVTIPEKSGDELGDLARDFNFLAKTLLTNEEDRKKWVADIAHELRTPLTLLSGELEAVEDGVRPLNRDTVTLLQADINHLIRLVSDLNELSKTDLGSVSYKKELMDSSKVLKRSVEKFRDSFKSFDLKLIFECENNSIISGDSERINQLFCNIIQNAMDYTDPGGTVKISSKQSDRYIVYTFEDSNPGVSDSDLPKLFDRLYRVESSRSRAFGGSGLGLAICKNIVEAHSGTIEALHSHLGGLSVIVKFPIT